VQGAPTFQSFFTSSLTPKPFVSQKIQMGVTNPNRADL
jgi:hypothetical protein